MTAEANATLLNISSLNVNFTSKLKLLFNFSII